MKTRPGDQPLPVVNNLPCVQDMVIADIEARKALGRQRYGTVLQPFNGRNALRDAYEEAVDLAVYLRQCLYESAASVNAGATPSDQGAPESAHRSSSSSLSPSETPEGWQPIETAPKDGSDILVAVDTGVDMANWQDEKPDGTECGVVVDPGLPAGWYGYAGLCPWDAKQPTHWMPLPSPPVTSKGWQS